MRKGNQRGKKPSRDTISKLWIAAGGRCQFEGCNENLFRDDLTWKEFNGANVAHIIASSPNGPRGSEKSLALSDKLDNLMLLCPKHHKEIDSFVDDYSVEKLCKMKQLQEQKVRRILNGMNYPSSEIVILESPIKGVADIRVDHSMAIDALRSNKQNPASSFPLLIRIDSHHDYSSPEYWKSVTDKLNSSLRTELHSRFQYNPSLQLAIFPMAPIPLIIKLGESIGDKRTVDVFQKTRTPDTWEWLNTKATNSFKTDVISCQNGDPHTVALILSLTAIIDEKRVTKVCDASIIFHLHAANNGVDCIASKKDLSLFWHEYQRVCDEIKNVYHANTVEVFPAVPVSAAFEIGRRHMPGVHPILQIYDDNNGFFKALKIGG